MSGGGGKNTTTTTQQVFGPEETAARKKIFEAGSSAFDQQQAMLQGMSNPGSVPVGPSAQTTQAQNMLTNYATGSGAQQSADMAGAVNYGLNGAMDVNNNPHLQGAIDAATRGIGRNYLDPNGVLANIRSSSINNGQYGGTRQGLGEGIAAGRYATEIGDVASSMASSAYDKGQDTFARTLGLAPAAMQAGAMPAQLMSALGMQNEQYGQQMNDYAAAGRAWELNKPTAAIGNYANLINGMSAPGTTATNSSSGGSGFGSALTGGLGGALGGAALGSQIGMIGGPMGAAIGGGLGILAGLF